jgi:chromatin modification-related protein VID21
MPLQSFFEHRIASQWTWDEDNELKGLVRDYSYNWSLISSILSSKSLFASGAERRTPWECFERWIHLEGLPADMVKTHYFRAYTNRIETANRIVMAQAQQMPQQPNANGQVQVPPRRRPTTGIRVERRRNQKHLTLVDAMRKLAKKRETNAQKQQHAQGMAAMRKANEVPQAANRNVGHTPQDFSRMKAEREEVLRERMLELQRRQEANRRVY